MDTRIASQYPDPSRRTLPALPSHHRHSPYDQHSQQQASRTWYPPPPPPPPAGPDAHFAYPDHSPNATSPADAASPTSSSQQDTSQRAESPCSEGASSQKRKSSKQRKASRRVKDMPLHRQQKKRETDRKSQAAIRERTKQRLVEGEAALAQADAERATMRVGLERRDSYIQRLQQQIISLGSRPVPESTQLSANPDYGYGSEFVGAVSSGQPSGVGSFPDHGHHHHHHAFAPAPVTAASQAPLVTTAQPVWPAAASTDVFMPTPPAYGDGVPRVADDFGSLHLSTTTTTTSPPSIATPPFPWHLQPNGI